MILTHEPYHVKYQTTAIFEVVRIFFSGCPNRAAKTRSGRALAWTGVGVGLVLAWSTANYEYYEYVRTSPVYFASCYCTRYFRHQHIKYVIPTRQCTERGDEARELYALRFKAAPGTRHARRSMLDAPPLHMKRTYRD